MSLEVGFVEPDVGVVFVVLVPDDGGGALVARIDWWMSFGSRSSWIASWRPRQS